jgi:hypothetical protein
MKRSLVTIKYACNGYYDVEENHFTYTLEMLDGKIEEPKEEVLLICNMADKCNEAVNCGASKPHAFDKDECNKCRIIPSAKCVKYEEPKEVKSCKTCEYELEDCERHECLIHGKSFWKPKLADEKPKEEEKSCIGCANNDTGLCFSCNIFSLWKPKVEKVTGICSGCTLSCKVEGATVCAKQDSNVAKVKNVKKHKKHKEMIEKLDEIRCGLIDVETAIENLCKQLSGN